MRAPRPRDRLWIQSVYRDYLDDLNPGTGLSRALGEVGHREPDQIAHWFGDPNTFPLIIVKGSRAGGVCARAARAGSAAQRRIDYRMAEFFVARARRRLGVGPSAVHLILSRFAGRWEISEYLRNAAAVNFWRRVVAGYTAVPTRSASSTAKCTRCSIPRSRARLSCVRRIRFASNRRRRA